VLAAYSLLAYKREEWVELGVVRFGRLDPNVERVVERVDNKGMRLLYSPCLLSCFSRHDRLHKFV